jgi:hypothetical protein
MITSGSDTRAMAMVEQIGRARGLTMIDSMAKPFRLAQLRARLSELVQSGAK